MDQIRQQMQETSEERETRSAGNFPSVERMLPILKSRHNYSFVDSVTSYLGLRNPFARMVQAETEVVWPFDNTAYRTVGSEPDKPQPWQAEFVVAYFLKNSGWDASEVVAQIADKIGVTKINDDGERKCAESTIRERIQPFLDAIRPARMVDIEYPSGEVQRLGPAGRNGVSSQIVQIPGEHADGESTEVTALPKGVSSVGPMAIHFAEPSGWAVISGTPFPLAFTLLASANAPTGLQTSTTPSKSP